MRNKKDKSIINSIAAREQLDPKLIENLIKELIINAKASMKDDEMSEVYIAGFGRFVVPYGVCNIYILDALKHYREGRITREKCVSVVSKLWKVRRKNRNKRFKMKRK